MAEKAAHITSSLQARPSIFEVIAQESLSELLFPSFKIIIEIPFPSSLHQVLLPHSLVSLPGTVSMWFRNLNTKGGIIVNGNKNAMKRLSNNTSNIEAELLRLLATGEDASFAESFYGLYRVEGESKISTKARYWSLFCLVGVPYLTRKIEKYVSNHENHKVSLCHKTLLASWKTVSLVQYLMYLTGRATAHAPLLSVVNLNLQYFPEQPQLSVTWEEFFRNPKACLRVVSNGLTQGLELGAFFLQCLQWWHSDESSGKLASAIVPPPPPLTCVVEDSSSALCPVCHKKCHIETALATSGYVFCFRCIREAISADQRCPVTKLPTSLDQLVRLYPSTDT